ncbi:hypothetical protein GLW08_04155 [Pontibacillus yanchengensis]|uniref:histidine kinase n=2 Tax=Pontibacillus yanchengensis TaxID=462910 RepID=A0A6I5A0H1_9BACI|nr:hypothetical protein [Pontibacillus yanchengensis]MYL52529.1 hypothetical protein [Pontibacillus yanchengensis]
MFWAIDNPSPLPPLNLLTNAIRYTPPKGKIYISTKSVDENIVVSISDSGIGILEEEQSRVFERFYKVDKSSIQTCSS